MKTMIPSEATAYTVAAQLPADITSGAMVTIENASGTTVYSATAGKNISSIYASSADFAAGTYTVYADGAAVCTFTFTADSYVASTCTVD